MWTARTSFVYCLSCLFANEIRIKRYYSGRAVRKSSLNGILLKLRIQDSQSRNEYCRFVYHARTDKNSWLILGSGLT